MGLCDPTESRSYPDISVGLRLKTTKFCTRLRWREHDGRIDVVPLRERGSEMTRIDKAIAGLIGGCILMLGGALLREGELRADDPGACKICWCHKEGGCDSLGTGKACGTKQGGTGGGCPKT